MEALLMKGLRIIICMMLVAYAGQASPPEHVFSDEDRNWWAVQPVRDPHVPAARDAEWVRNPIDHFILRRLGENGLDVAQQAQPQELVRRLYFDVHGLPPTSEQAEAFLAVCEKDAKAATADLIDELLAHRRYGERWASHWLDVVRYAESDGYRADDLRPTVHLYRDYVIDALNADKPYRQFVREQLAADEFAYEDPDKLIATAFLRHGVYEWNQRNARMQWDIILNEMTRVTGEVFLGIGIGCARCHDHKFDPLLQQDYYGLQAFLSSTWWPENRKLGTKAELAALRIWNARTSDLRAELGAIEQEAGKGKVDSTVKQFPEDVQAIYHKPSQERTTHEEQLAQLVERQVVNQRGKSKIEDALKKKPEVLARYQELRKELDALEKGRPKLTNAFITIDVGPKPARTAYKTRSGEVEVEPTFPALLGLPAPKIRPMAESTGRRTALADWITHDDNPLAPRVIVNRVWQHHFGRGLVPTPNDFGTLGQAPSHPELLDWLTSRFIEGGWRLKDLHRLILNSATYQQTARREPGPSEKIKDPDNRLLWRFTPKRLSAEQLRDAMLAVSGELRNKDGGPSEDGKNPVRSIYVRKRRNSPDNVLKCFDAPTGFDSAPNRPHTTTPIQALLLINDEWPLQRARAVATSILRKKPGTTDETVAMAYQQVYGRSPNADELTTATEFLGHRPATAITVAKPKPAHKFPGETGLRPIGQHFAKVNGLDLGKHALWLQPGSRFEKLHAPKKQLEVDAFTIEAVAILDSLHKDASVNTLASRWNGSHKSAGWTFGVTSTKSRYQPRNFILQLIGKNVGGSTVYEVVPSNLRIPTGKPAYLAASIRTHPDGKSSAVFYYLDLTQPDAVLQESTVNFQIANGVQNPASNLLVGGRDQRGHLWDGQLARLVITPRALEKQDLLISSPAQSHERTIDLLFNQPADSDNIPIPGTAWIRQATPAPKPVSPMQAALVDLCHVLLNSNEFLYLH